MGGGQAYFGKTQQFSRFLILMPPLKVDFCQIFSLVKSTNCQYLDLEAKNEKSKTTLLSENSTK